MDQRQATEALADHLWRTIGASMAFLMRESPGLEARLTREAWMLLSGEPIPNFNLAFIAAGQQAEAHVREVVAALRRRSLPGLIFFGSPVADQLTAIIEELGLQPAGPAPLMTVNAVDAVSALRRGGVSGGEVGLDVQLVTNNAMLAGANAVVAPTFGLPDDIVSRAFDAAFLATPGLACFVALVAGETFATVLTLRVGETVGIWNMATLPTRQRQGVGRAVLGHALRHHANTGASLFYLLATPEGLPLYNRIGFRTVAEPAVWFVAPGSDEAT